MVHLRFLVVREISGTFEVYSKKAWYRITLLEVIELLSVELFNNIKRGLKYGFIWCD